MIVVNYPIEVPSGKYCWGPSFDEVCEFHDNEGGHDTCNLQLGGLKNTGKGCLKAKKCLKLKKVGG